MRYGTCAGVVCVDLYSDDYATQQAACGCGLLCGATPGGNLTPIGASSNIAAIGILKREGYEVKTGDFMRIGIPFTLAAVLCGYIFCWIVWA